MRSFRGAWLALALGLVPGLALAQETPPETPAPVQTPGARLYLGAAATSNNSDTGSAIVLGYQGFWGRGRSVSGMWGLELLGVKLGNGYFPVFTGDLGLRFMPWPTGFLRPYVKGGVGLSLLIILPVPSVHFSLGLGIPLGPELVFDVSLSGRRAFNLFDVNNSINVATFELGLGF